jgi:hypothetical protein
MWHRRRSHVFLAGLTSPAPHNAERHRRDLMWSPHNNSQSHFGPSGSLLTGMQSIGSTKDAHFFGTGIGSTAEQHTSGSFFSCAAAAALWTLRPLKKHLPVTQLIGNWRPI